MAGPPSERTDFTGPRLIGGALLILGLFILLQTFQIGPSRGFSPVPPNAMPTVVAVGIILLAVIFLARVTVRPDADLGVRAAREDEVTHWPTAGLLAGILIAYAFALAPVGYPVATALLVPGVARVLGSRSVIRDLLVGTTLGLLVWFGFTQLLGVRLSAGILDVVLPGSG